MISRAKIRLARLATDLARFLALVLLSATSHVLGSGVTGDYFADVWTPENGLPDSSVSSIVQTPDGYLWIGTFNGLARFDGERFVTFDPANTPALTHARVRKLFVDSRGTLWINTYDGSLTTLRQGTFALERRNPRPSEAELALISSSSNRVIFLTSRGDLLRKPLTAPVGTGWEELTPPERGLGTLCCEDGQGTLWYRDCNGHLCRVVNERFEQLPESAGLAGQEINCLTTDATGRLWLGTDKGLSVWNGVKFQNLTPTNAESSCNVTFLFITTNNHVWAVVNGRMREAAGRQWIPEPEALRGIFTGDLSRAGAQEDHHGGIWFYNYGRGLLHLNADGQIQELTPKDGFPKEPINCFFEDREGNAWAGLDAGGLIRVREKRFHAVDEGKGILPVAAKSVCEDGSGAIWIGTLGGGLDCWRDGIVTNLNLPGGMESVFCVCPDANGRLWMSAGDDDDLYVRQDGKFKLVSPAVRGVKAILAGHDGRIWVGTKSGLYFAGPAGNFQIYKGVPKHYVRALAEDDAGILWAGAGNGDLYRIDGDAVTTFHAADSQASEAIWSVLADKDGTVWAGTFRGGLLRLRNGKFTRFDKEDGLPDNVICQVLDDGQGNLWLGSHRGIIRVSKLALDADADGKIKILPCDTYGQSDGLPSLECSGNYQPAAWRSRDGRLWFATIKGVAFTQPRAVRQNLMPPPVVIEEVLVDGKIQHPVLKAQNGENNKMVPSNAGFLEVQPGARRFEFHFAGLSLSAPDEVRFRYKLEGFETDWVEAGTQRSAQYNFLPPGDYRFHVIACNSDGIWNEAGSVLTLKILPHFYETWWFRALAGLAAAGLLAGTIRYTVTRRLRRKMEQLKRQQAIERERTRIAKDLHDDLGASLTLIAVLGDLAKKEKTGQRIEKMSSTARQAVKSLDEIVWAVNPGNDTLAHLIDYAGQFATDYLRDAGIRCLLDVPEQTPAREVPTNVRHNVFLVIKEALQNIVKHSRATEVWLRFGADADGLRIVIEDNGCGFVRAPQEAWADGLRNIRQRLAEIGGECEIQTRVGAGTIITVGLPCPAG